MFGDFEDVRDFFDGDLDGVVEEGRSEFGSGVKTFRVGCEICSAVGVCDASIRCITVDRASKSCFSMNIRNGC